MCKSEMGKALAYLCQRRVPDDDTQDILDVIAGMSSDLKEQFADKVDAIEDKCRVLEDRYEELQESCQEWISMCIEAGNVIRLLEGELSLLGELISDHRMPLPEVRHRVNLGLFLAEDDPRRDTIYFDEDIPEDYLTV